MYYLLSKLSVKEKTFSQNSLDIIYTLEYFIILPLIIILIGIESSTQIEAVINAFVIEYRIL